MTWTFEPQLQRASTIPSRYYSDPGVLEAEYRTVFGRTWQLAGRAQQVASPGQYFSTVVGNEPVLITRGQDGALNAMSNVCRHRAGPVAKGEGQRSSIQCRYHGWT